jgi:hypothetical protein
MAEVTVYLASFCTFYPELRRLFTVRKERMKGQEYLWQDVYDIQSSSPAWPNDVTKWNYETLNRRETHIH